MSSTNASGKYNSKPVSSDEGKTDKMTRWVLSLESGCVTESLTFANSPNHFVLAGVPTESRVMYYYSTDYQSYVSYVLFIIVTLEGSYCVSLLPSSL